MRTSTIRLCNSDDIHTRESELANDIIGDIKSCHALDGVLSLDELQSIYLILQERLSSYFREVNMRREVKNLIEDARNDFANLERSKDLQEVANIRSSLRRAGVGFAVLDPQGRTSEEEMAIRLDQLQQESHMQIARRYLDRALSSGHYYDIDRLYGHLEMAGATLEDLATERNTTAKQLNRELKTVANIKAKRRLWREMEDNAPISP